MKRVNNSKEPTNSQIEAILSNLQEKYPKSKFTYSLEIWGSKATFYHYYSLIIKDEEGTKIPILNASWPEFLEKYRELMEVKDE